MINAFSWFRKTPKEQNKIIDKPHYVFIHGANQSRICWNYVIKELELSSNDYTCIEYSSINSFNDNVDSMSDIIDKIPDGSCFIGHSLGGIYAIHLYKHHPAKFKQAITISTPFGGSGAADYLRYMSPNTQLLKDVGRRSLPITTAFDIDINIPWTQIVTVRGNSPWLRSRNDGVVTERSMIIRDDLNYIEVLANHYEVLVFDPVIDIIKDLTIEHV